MDERKYWLNMITAELKVSHFEVDKPQGSEWKEISRTDYEFYEGLELLMKENGE